MLDYFGHGFGVYCIVQASSYLAVALWSLVLWSSMEWFSLLWRSEFALALALRHCCGLAAANQKSLALPPASHTCTRTTCTCIARAIALPRSTELTAAYPHCVVASWYVQLVQVFKLACKLCSARAFRAAAL